MRLGVYPTPVERLAGAIGPDRDLWVKRDDRTSPRYGGNKVRKLERLLAIAQARGARRIVTVGAAGSHHVLATALFAGDLGIAVDAVLVPQPRTDHVAEILRAIAARARIWPATSFPDAGVLVLDRIACGAHYIPVGGSTRAGALAYADAAAELIEQVRRGELPEPATVVVALGSGGTAGGLAAGFAAAGSRTRVVAVLVSEPAAWVARRARRLASLCLADLVPRGTKPSPSLLVADRYLGPGYGRATEEGHRAARIAARFGITLDGTYTAKTFAAALDSPPEDGPVLYWHTLSSAPMGPLLEGAPREEDLGADERALLVLPADEGGAAARVER